MVSALLSLPDAPMKKKQYVQRKERLVALLGLEGKGGFVSSEKRSGSDGEKLYPKARPKESVPPKTMDDSFAALGVQGRVYAK